MPEAYCVECDSITHKDSKCRSCKKILCERHLLEGMQCESCKNKKSKCMPFFFSRDEKLHFADGDNTEKRLYSKSVSLEDDPDAPGETMVVMKYTTAKPRKDPF